MGAQWKMPRVPRRPWGLLLDVATAIPVAETSENFPNTNGTNRMPMGVTYVPWGCDRLRIGDAECGAVELVLEDGDAAGDEGDPGFSPGYTELENAFPATLYQKAFRIADGLGCSDLSSRFGDLRERVSARMDLMTSEAFARQLISGVATTPIVGGDLAGEGNHNFSDDATVITTISASIEHALIAIDEWLATALHGGRGIIHVSPGILSNLMGQAGAKVTDGEIVTASGHLVAADAGYVGMAQPDGQATPAADQRWIYASGPVWYQMSDFKIYDDESNIPTVNRLVTFGEAFGIVLYDPCAVGAALVDLAPA